MIAKDTMTMEIGEFFEGIFLPEWLQTCNRSVMTKYRATVDWFLLFRAGKATTVADITDDQLEQFQDWLRVTKRAGPNKQRNASRSYGSRLRQIRRHARAKMTGTKDMRLADFFKNVYLKERPLKGFTIRTYRSCIIRLTRFYGSDVMLTELSAELFERFREYYAAKSHEHTAKKILEVLIGIWNCAHELGYCADGPNQKKKPNPAPIVTSGDALRMILTTKFFPTRWAIRSEKTKEQYKFALNDFAQYLEHEPTIENLDDDTVTGFMIWMRDTRKLAPKTCNERVGRVLALWKWLAAKRITPTAPSVGRIPEPKRTPSAWTQEELVKLFDEAKRTGGFFGRHKSRDYWLALFMWLWNTGARIGETMELEWSMIDEATRIVTIPPESRKGQKEAVYRIWPETLDAMGKIYADGVPRVFDSGVTYFAMILRFDRLLKRAGLSHTRYDKFHKFRRSVASHLRAAGGNDVRALGHTSEGITEKSYRDPRIIGQGDSPLFKPWESKPTEDAK